LRESELQRKLESSYEPGLEQFAGKNWKDAQSCLARVIADVDPRMPPSLIKSRAVPTACARTARSHYIVAQLMEELPQEQASIS